MEKTIHGKYSAPALIFKAMAHPTRLLIIEKLSVREHCVCEFQEMVGADMSTISKHLLILKNAGIVSDEKRGQMVFYKIKFPCVLKFLSCIETALRKQAKAQWELAR